MHEFNSITEVVKELVATQNKLAKAEKELEALKQKRSKRRKVNPDSAYLKILTIVRRRMKGQEVLSNTVIKRITYRTLVKESYDSKDFFIKFGDTIRRLKEYQSFTEDCSELKLSDVNAVAQFVALQGEARVQKVFKLGLREAMKDLLHHVPELIFSDEEIKMYQQQSLEQEKIEELSSN